MRYTPSLKLSTRLVAFVTVIVTSAMFILFIGGTFSFQRLGQEYLNHYLQGVVEVVDKELDQHDTSNSMQRWMPNLLQASSIVEMSLSSDSGVIYRFRDTNSKVEASRLYKTHFPLKRNQGLTLYFEAIPPYVGFTYSFSAMWSITFAIILVIFCLMRGVKWLKAQLLGSELLEERGRMILAGRVEGYAKGDHREWPYTASEALDKLIDELRDSRQERSRFDTFIRSHAFLDQLTGAANRVLFDSKLESFLLENGVRGGVIFIAIEDLDQVEEETKQTAGDELIVQLGELISNVIQRYPDVVLSRYYDSVFAVLIPHQSARELSKVSTQCLSIIERLTPPEPLDKNNWCHIGFSMFEEGESHSRIIGEVEEALKGAQREGVNAWDSFNKSNQISDERGNVRWRTLFEHAFTQEHLHLYKQDCFESKENHAPRLIHSELFTRIEERPHRFLKASRFSSAIETLGYETLLDKAVVTKVLAYCRAQDDPKSLSINLYVTPFENRSYFKWFRDELMQLPSRYRAKLSFEFAEGHVVEHLDYIRPVIRMISAFGCEVIIGQAGRTIVSTHYIKDLNIDYLKLHRSLIKRIEKRHENQLFIRSVIGVCSGTKTRVIAVGVQNKQELATLQELGIFGAQGRLFDSEALFLPKQKLLSSVKAGPRKRWKKK
ncbi:RNase E specificity factor CsrD [Vibrio sp. WJH972]